MSNEKYKTAKIAAIIVTLLMFSSAFQVLSNSPLTNVNAQTTTATIPADLLQYEWVQSTADASRSFASDGPGPNSFNIKWRTHLPNVVGQPIAFAGKIFVQTRGYVYGSGRTTYCLDAATGKLLWTANGVIGSITKLDNNYMLIGNNAYKIADGTLAWKCPFGIDLDYGPFGYVYGMAYITGVGYDPATKTYYSGSILGYPPEAWKFSDASQPPTRLWSRVNQSDYGYYGTEIPKVLSQGILVCATSYQYLLGIDAATGKTLWATPTKISQWIYGMSVENSIIGFGGLDGNFYGWNLTTGALMWTYNPGSYMNQFAAAVGSAYGMFYEHNQDTYIYAINATTGQLVWKANGSGVAYSNILTIAGGKIYAQMGENQYVDFVTGESGHSEFYCLDAYTGKLVWSAPFETGAPFNSQCNAYGNLYVTPMVSSVHPGEFIYSCDRPDGGIYGSDGGIGEVWCISDTPQDWSMAFNDPAHSSFGNGPTHLSLTWTVTTGGGIVSSPTLVNGVAYLDSYDGNIYAFNATTGAQIWNYSTGILGFSSTLAVVNNRVYTGADDGNVYCLDATSGTKIWQANAGGKKSSGSPTVTGNKVYVGAADGNLYCFDAGSGSVLWKFNAGGAISVTPAVDVDNGWVFTPSNAGLLFKLDANTGTQIWNVTILGWLGSKTITASPVLGAGMVFVRAANRYNYAFNATTGEKVWMADARYNPGTAEQANGAAQSCAVLYKYGKVYFNDYYGITAVNAFNGSELWHTWLSRENLAQGLSYSYGRIYTVNENGVLYVLDSLTGQKLANYDFVGGGAQLHSMPTPYNGSLYVASLDWNLYRFDEAAVPAIVTTNMTLTLSANSITKGDKIYITGGVSPINYPVNVTLTLDRPDSLYVDIPVTADANGNFMVIQTFDIVGEWKVVAWWNGDDTHTAAYSESLPLTVVEPEPAPAPATKSDAEQIMANLATLVPLLWGVIATIVISAVAICLSIYTIRTVRKLKK